jgi:hypothetical protein
MDRRAIRRDSSRNRGVSASEYLIVVIFIGISVIITYRSFGKQLKCLVATATNTFGGAESPSCGGNGGAGSPGSGSPGSSSPGGGGPAGPPPGVTCVGTSCTAAGSCFVAGTLIQTAEGAAPIESIPVGALVLARPEAGGALAWKPVLRTFARVAPALVELRVGGGATTDTVDVTPEHRLETTARGWVQADELVPGSDELVDAEGAALPLVSAASLPGAVAVYNLEVADFHTYFVGAHAVWAHNTCAPQANPDGTFSVPGHPGLTLTYDPGESDPQYGYNVYTITGGPLNGQQVNYDGPDRTYYTHPNGDPVQNEFNSNYPPSTLNNGGGTTYNFNNKPGVQVVSLSSVLSQVTLRDNPKDPSGLQTAMNSNTPLDPIVLHHEPGGGISVTDGNTRLQAAINNGLQNIPVIYDN